MRIAPKFRRGNFSRCVPFSLALAVLALAPTLADAEISDPQDIAQLEALAKSEAAMQFPKLTERQRFLVGPIESRLRFDKCSRPVRPVVVLAAAHERSGHDRAALPGCRNPGTSMCPSGSSAPRPSPSRRMPSSQVRSSKRPICKVEEHDVSELPLGFLDDPAIAVGLTASRPIAGGAYLTNQQLTAAEGGAAGPIRDAGGRCRRH